MIQQFVRYAIIGAGNTALDFAMYAGLTRGFDFWREHYLWANALTFITVVTWSFYWNKRWAFKNQDVRHKEQYVKFVIVTIIGIGITQTVLYTGVQVFGLHDILSKVLAAPLVVVWNFLAYRRWAFRGQENEESKDSALSTNFVNLFKKKCDHMNERWWFVLSSVIFALYPSLHVASKNANAYSLVDFLVTIFFSIIIALLMNAVFWILFRCTSRSSVLGAVSVLLFFSYGSVIDFTRGWEIGGIVVGRIRYVLVAFILLFALIMITIVRNRIPVRRTALAMVVVAVSLAIFPLMTITLSFQGQKINEEFGIDGEISPPIHEGLKRDIYYIILDGYTNGVVLSNVHNFDNSPFLAALEKRGFFVARSSLSNYTMTDHSLPSSLNMDYVFNKEWSGMSQKRLALMKQERFEVARILKNNGYTFVSFRTGRGNPFADRNITCGKFNEFTYVVIRMSLLRFFEDRLIGKDHRDRVLCAFDRLPEITQSSEPTFTFAHIISPHPPYVFDAKGGSVVESELAFSAGWENSEAYTNQIQFLNTKVIDLVDDLIKNSDSEPIIVIQGDHGSAAMLEEEGWENPSDKAIWERMGILNVYYLPAGGKEALYESISPVNSFRFILNYYFDSSYDLLKDRSYFSSYENPEHYTDVTDRIKILSEQKLFSN